MATKNLKTRMQQKVDISANWDSAANSFKPLKGEICVYSDLGKFKVGDGIHYINELDFFYQDDIDGALNAIAEQRDTGKSYQKGDIAFDDGDLQVFNGINWEHVSIGQLLTNVTYMVDEISGDRYRFGMRGGRFYTEKV